MPGRFVISTNIIEEDSEGAYTEVIHIFALSYDSITISLRPFNV